jgi:hypothetical protein
LNDSDHSSDTFDEFKDDVVFVAIVHGNVFTGVYGSVALRHKVSLMVEIAKEEGGGCLMSKPISNGDTLEMPCEE